MPNQTITNPTKGKPAMLIGGTAMFVGIFALETWGFFSIAAGLVLFIIGKILHWFYNG